MRTPRPLPPELPDLASTQEGLVTARQLVACGVDDDWISRLVKQHRVVRVTRGVYDTILVPPSDRTGPDAFAHRRRRSAVVGLLAYGSRAVASGLCALALHGVDGLPADVLPEVALCGPGNRTPRDGITARRYEVSDVVVADGWPTVPVEDALVQGVPTLGRRRALAVLDSVRHLGLADAATVARAHERARGRRGVESAHDVWRLADARAESPLESVARLSLIDAELGPDTLQLEFVDSRGRVRARCDLAWWLGDRWLVLEVDGAGPHTEPQALFRDRERQNVLQASGVLVLRVTAREVWSGTTPQVVEATLRRAAWRPGRLVPTGPHRLDLASPLL